MDFAILNFCSFYLLIYRGRIFPFFSFSIYFSERAGCEFKKKISEIGLMFFATFKTRYSLLSGFLRFNFERFLFTPDNIVFSKDSKFGQTRVTFLTISITQKILTISINFFFCKASVFAKDLRFTCFESLLKSLLFFLLFSLQGKYTQSNSKEQ